MPFSDVKIHYYQTMLRIRSQRLLVFAQLIPIACFLLLFGVATQAAGSQIQDQVREHFLAAQRAQQQGRLDDAASEYNKALRLHPGLAEAYINLGLVYYSQAKFQQSAAALASANKLKPGMRGVNLWRGIDEVKLGHPEQGAALLRMAVRQDPTDKMAQSWLATALWNAGQIDGSLFQLSKACAQFPDDPDLLFARGEAYGKAAAQQTAQLLEQSAGTALSDLVYGTHYAAEHDWTKAEGHLRRAIARDPHLLDARLELAGIFLQQAEFPAVQEQLDQIIGTTPRSAAALARSGELLLLEQRQEDGLARIAASLAIDQSAALDALGLPLDERFDQSVRSDEDGKLLSLSREAARSLQASANASPARHAALAALYAIAGDEEAAKQEYRLIGPRRNEAKLPASALARAMTATHEHRYDDAEALLVGWLSSNPGDNIARYDLIVTRRHIAQLQVARLLAVAPDSYHVHQLLGQTYANAEEDEKALAEYLAVAAAQPDLPGIHFWLGHLYWKHGDADHALKELQRELELSPDHPEAKAELGTVLLTQERSAEAIDKLEAAIRAKPDLWPAYTQLGHAYAIEKNYRRAEEVLKRGLAHDTDGAAHYQLGLVLRAEGKAAEASQAFAKVRAIKAEKMAVPSDTTADSGVHP